MDDNTYNELLDRAFSKLPTLSSSKEDFVIPQVDSMVQGSKTIIRNINAIAEKARRPVSDIARFLGKELSVPVSTEEQRVVLSGRFMSDVLDSKIKKYFDNYVICKECHKPDTHLESAERGLYLVCEACGARYWVKSY
ncbi:MAG: translation initiation factor IF-2 subunit beta [Candidatus Micrarchaeia archaeon]